MARMTIEDLKNIKDRVSKETSLRHGKSSIKVTVHMGTCGIAAGARDVMNALMEEMGESDRDDIRVMASGCIGMCSSEPNVTIEIQEKEPIVYKEMDANKMRQVFKRHVMMGEVQTDFALGKL